MASSSFVYVHHVACFKYSISNEIRHKENRARYPPNGPVSKWMIHKQ